jgi:acyl-CoA thioesterase FadM
MLYAWYKIASILAIHSNRPLSHIGEEISLSFRVRLFDCDGFKIMSDFQYPTHMYLSSWVLCTRVRSPKTILTKIWASVAASQKTIYWRPLKLWSSFTVKASFTGWDDKWYCQEHVFQ